MHIIWCPQDSCFNFSPTSWAVRPLIPASISSNISVCVSSFPAITVFIASIILDSSPPEATFESGFNGSPTFVDIINLTESPPLEVK